jgi:hypothetical protein
MLIPTATDRFVRPARDDEASRTALLWLRADDAVSVDDVRAARAARATRTDVTGDDALAFAVAAATKAPTTAATNPKLPAPKTLASWLRSLIDEAVHTAPLQTLKHQRHPTSHLAQA